MADNCTPTDAEIAEWASKNSIPVQSYKRYYFQYQLFNDWRQENNVTAITENSVLAYLKELSTTKAPSTLWTTYSMLKRTLETHEDINIAKFKKVLSFMKVNSKGFKSKKASSFTGEDIERFLRDAPDKIYLAAKVVAIFSMSGAWGPKELKGLMENDVVEQPDHTFLVKISKAKKRKVFVVEGSMAETVQKYCNIRAKITRFFCKYDNGKVGGMPMGIHTLEQMPKKIATYLKLENASKYSTQSFRGASATLQADGGAGIIAPERDGNVNSVVHNKTFAFQTVCNVIMPEISVQNSDPLEPGTSKTPENVQFINCNFYNCVFKK